MMIAILHQYGDLVATFGVLLVLAILAWQGGADTVTPSLTDRTGRRLHWSL